MKVKEQSRSQLFSIGFFGALGAMPAYLIISTLMMFIIGLLGVRSAQAQELNDSNEVQAGARAISNKTKPGFMLGDDRVAMGEPRYKIVIIDTGYDPIRATAQLKLCPTEHYDYLTRSGNVNYAHPHGTRVASIIADKLKNVDYCAVVLQVSIDGTPSTTLDVLTDAYRRVAAMNATVVNQSMYFWETNRPDLAFAMKETEADHTILFLIAGNDGRNLDAECLSYPACYQLNNKIVSGAQDEENPKKHWKQSNYGKVVEAWAPGYSYDKDGIREYGTSFAAPRALAEYILFWEHRRLAADTHD